MNAPLANERFPYFSEEHEMLRTTLRRFIAGKVHPVADAWEEQGFVPREVLREMGALGLLGMRYAPEHGGAGSTRWPTRCWPRSLAAPPTAASR
jgi:acyl-CoA dehydrogenase